MDNQYARIAHRRRWAPILVASVVLSALTWIDWTFTGESWFGVPYPVVILAALVINVVVTGLGLRHKRLVVAAFQRWLLNPPVRLLLRLGLPLGWTLLETTGRRSAQPRVVPVDDDPYARQRWLIGWTHPLRALIAMVVRVLGTDPVTIRIDLDTDDRRVGNHAAAAGADVAGEGWSGGLVDAGAGGESAGR